MIPIDRQVQQTMGAFRGQPDKLMQRYKQGNDLIDLLALQQMKSDMDAVKQQMVLSQQQMPGTIKDQREQEVLAGYKEKAGRQVGDVAKNTAGLLNQRQASVNANMQRQGITQQPTRAASNGGLMKMAGGGIVRKMANGGIVAGTVPSIYGVSKAAVTAPTLTISTGYNEPSGPGKTNPERCSVAVAVSEDCA